MPYQDAACASVAPNEEISVRAYCNSNPEYLSSKPMTNSYPSQIEESLSSLKKRKGVEGYIVLNDEGLVIVSDLPDNLSKRYGQQIAELIQKSQATVTGLELQEELSFLRLRTKNHELMIANQNHHGCKLVVVLNVAESKQ